jgi:hypothetical protein
MGVGVLPLIGEKGSQAASNVRGAESGCRWHASCSLFIIRQEQAAGTEIVSSRCCVLQQERTLRLQ